MQIVRQKRGAGRVSRVSRIETVERSQVSDTVVLRLDRAQEERRKADCCSDCGGLRCWVVQALPLVAPQIAQDLLPLNFRLVTRHPVTSI